MSDNTNGDKPRVYLATHKKTVEFEKLLDDFEIASDLDKAEYIVVDLDEPPRAYHEVIQFLPNNQLHKYLSLPDGHCGPVFFFGGNAPPKDPDEKRRRENLMTSIESWCRSIKVHLHSSPDVPNLREDILWYDARLKLRRQFDLQPVGRSSIPPGNELILSHIPMLIEMVLHLSREQYQR
jgi:hypothetical protein